MPLVWVDENGDDQYVGVMKLGGGLTMTDLGDGVWELASTGGSASGSGSGSASGGSGSASGGSGSASGSSSSGPTGSGSSSSGPTGSGSSSSGPTGSGSSSSGPTGSGSSSSGPTGSASGSATGSGSGPPEPGFYCIWQDIWIGKLNCPGDPTTSMAQGCVYYYDRPAEEECENSLPDSSKIRYAGPYEDAMDCDMGCF